MISKNTGDVKKDTLLKNKRGITLIALIVTIVVMLILASVTIGAINGGLFDYARKSKIQTEIVDLKEQLEQKKIMSKTKITDGKINDILKIDSPYNDLLLIENGELVYKISETSNEYKQIFKELRIKESAIERQEIICADNPTTYYIVDEKNKKF